MLDTNACITAINRSNHRVIERILDQHSEDIVTSVVCAAELRFGAEKSVKREEALDKLQLFLSSIRAIPLDLPMLEYYGRLRAELSRKGRPIGPLDTLIAAHALSLGLTLVTSNTKEFRRVRGLHVEDWARS
jgi:tRNA(fMet)-specific endonuclease VapC